MPGAGVNTRLPSCAAAIICPAVTFAPESWSVAPGGSDSASIRTPLSVSPASPSLKPKSATLKARPVSCGIETALLAPLGRSLTGLMVIVVRSGPSASGPPSPLLPWSFTASDRNPDPL